MELRIAVAKTDRYGTTTTGDTVEITERPNGGISIVLADGQADDQDSKAISTMVSHKVIECIIQGLRDSAAIRAASNKIFLEYDGKVRAKLNVLSADLQTNTIVISRNNPAPVFLITEGKVDTLKEESVPIGTQMDICPSIVELPIIPEMLIVTISDGMFNAGDPEMNETNIITVIEAMIEDQEPSAKEMADTLLSRAIRLDNGRPKDDFSVVVMLVSPQSSDHIRRISATMDLDN